MSGDLAGIAAATIINNLLILECMWNLTQRCQRRLLIKLANSLTSWPDLLLTSFWIFTYCEYCETRMYLLFLLAINPDLISHPVNKFLINI